MKLVYILPLFLVSILAVLVVPKAFPSNAETIETNVSSEAFWIPSAPEPDVTIYNEWKGEINSSHPNYWGNYCYFMNQRIFFAQVGGVHCHSYYHTVWDETVYINSVTDSIFNSTRNQLIHYPNATLITLSNGTEFWMENMKCPLCDSTMSIPEFSPFSMAVYWYCHECRLFIGEDLSK